MKSSFKNLFTPKKLWILRLYVALLTYLVEFLLVIYVVLSLYNLLAQDNAFGDLILGYTGLYLVWICLAILFVAQVVSLFLSIHDNIEDVRNKAVDPDFSIDVASEKEKNKESSNNSFVIIITIILAIILSFVNLNRDNNSKYSGSETTQSNKSIEELLDDPDLLPLEVFKNFTQVERSLYSNYKLIYSNLQDLNGDGNNDIIEIFAEPDFFVSNKDYYFHEKKFMSLIKINNQLFTSLELLTNSKGNDKSNMYYACQVKIIDLDKTDRNKELFIELGQGGEDPPVEGYIVRFTDGIATITNLSFDHDNYYASWFESDNVLKLNHRKKFKADDCPNDEVKLQDFVIDYEIQSIGIKINSQTASDVYCGEWAACPFVYYWDGREFIFKGEIIRNLIGKDSEKEQFLKLGAFRKGKHKIRIWEKKDEVSYINYLYLTNDDIKIPLIIENNSCLTKVSTDDNSYHILNKDDYFEIIINLDRDVDNLILHAKGYYLPFLKPIL